MFDWTLGDIILRLVEATIMGVGLGIGNWVVMKRLK